MLSGSWVGRQQSLPSKFHDDVGVRSRFRVGAVRALAAGSVWDLSRRVVDAKTNRRRLHEPSTPPH